MLFRHEVCGASERVVDGGLPLLQGWEHRRGKPVRGLAEEYARGAICIVLQLDGRAAGNGGQRGVFFKAADEGVPLHLDCPASGHRDGDGGMAGGADDGREHSMLVRIVHKVQGVEAVALPIGEDLKGLDEVFDPLGLGFYSLAGGFEVDPRVASRKLEVAILRAAIPSDEIPDHVVQGDPHVVDSIAYYQGENARGLFEEANPNVNLSGFRICLDGESMRFFADEGCELPFNIRDVMIGPFKFLNGAIEHV